MNGTNGTRLFQRDEVGSGRGPGAWTPTVAGLNDVSPDGRWLGVLRRSSATLHVYGLPGPEPVARLTQLPHLGNIHSFAFSPTGDEVALSSSRGVEFWSTATWQRTRALTNFTRPLLYAPDGRSLWITKDQSSAGLYDARTLEPLLLLPSGMLPLAVSPDGRRLAVSVDGQRLQVWDLAVLREQFRVLGLDWAAAGP
jgi:WD40 repeat protein